MIHRVDAAVKVSRVRGSRVDKIADLKFGCEGTDALGALVATLQHVDGAPASEHLQRMEGDRRLGELFRRGNAVRDALRARSDWAWQRVQALCERLAGAGGVAHARVHHDRGWHHVEMAIEKQPAVEGTWSFSMSLPDKSLVNEAHRVREPRNEQLGTDLYLAHRYVEDVYRRRRRVRLALQRALDECLLAGL